MEIFTDMSLLEYDKFIAYNSLFMYYYIVEKCSNINYENKNLGIIIKYYNLFLSITSWYILLYTIFEKNVELSLHTLSCVTIKNSMIKWFYYIKYVEWLDTVFLLIKKKKVSTLHYYHHMIVPLLVYLNMGEENNGAQYYVLVSNSLAHGLMYFYYAYPNELRKYSKIVTLVQTIQHFGALIIILNQYINYNNCDFNKIPFILGLICYIFFFVEFTKILFKSKLKIK